MMELEKQNQTRETHVLKKEASVLQSELSKLEKSMLHSQLALQKNYRQSVGKKSKPKDTEYENPLVAAEARLAEEELQYGDLKMELILERRTKHAHEMQELRLENQIAYAEDVGRSEVRLMETKCEEERRKIEEDMRHKEDELQRMGEMTSELAERNMELTDTNGGLEEMIQQLEMRK